MSTTYVTDGDLELICTALLHHTERCRADAKKQTNAAMREMFEGSADDFEELRLRLEAAE